MRLIGNQPTHIQYTLRSLFGSCLSVLIGASLLAVSQKHIDELRSISCSIVGVCNSVAVLVYYTTVPCP